MKILKRPFQIVLTTRINTFNFTDFQVILHYLFTNAPEL